MKEWNPKTLGIVDFTWNVLQKSLFPLIANCRNQCPKKHKISTNIRSNTALEAAFKTMKNPTLSFPDVLQEMSQKLAHFEALRELLFRPVRHLFFESILAHLRPQSRKVFAPVPRAFSYIDARAPP